MSQKRPLRVPADLDVIPIRIESPPGDLDWVRCVGCSDQLALHQPDVQAPARLLGFCDGCRRWYLLLMEPELDVALMVALPEGGWFRAAWDSHGGAG